MIVLGRYFWNCIFNRKYLVKTIYIGQDSCRSPGIIDSKFTVKFRKRNPIIMGFPHNKEISPFSSYNGINTALQLPSLFLGGFPQLSISQPQDSCKDSYPDGSRGTYKGAMLFNPSPDSEEPIYKVIHNSKYREQFILGTVLIIEVIFGVIFVIWYAWKGDK
jgi:hypothetical protein